MKIVIHQICYSEETLRNIPEGFLVLDNTKNERPDWREFWPIRNFLKSNQLCEDTLYGFFSPKFNQKTGLDLQKIQEFIESNYRNHDSVSFSPFWDLGSIFINIFEQGDFFHPGLMDVSEEFSRSHLNGFQLQGTVSHSNTNVFCNYILGTRTYWEKWLEIGEMLFFAADYSCDNLSVKLQQETTYGSQKLPMKIFLQERIATLCLMKWKDLKNLSYSPFLLGSSTTPFKKFWNESINSDALKIAFSQTENNLYINEFNKIREKIKDSL